MKPPVAMFTSAPAAGVAASPAISDRCRRALYPEASCSSQAAGDRTSAPASNSPHPSWGHGSFTVPERQTTAHWGVPLKQRHSGGGDLRSVASSRTRLGRQRLRQGLSGTFGGSAFVSPWSLGADQLQRGGLWNNRSRVGKACATLEEAQGEGAIFETSPTFGSGARSLFRGLRESLTADPLGLEIASVALPALLAVVAEPLASLVDTFFVAQLGAAELAAVGVSASIFNLVAKVFNFPLLNVTTSFVAEDGAKMGIEDMSMGGGKVVLPSVSSALVLSLGLGLLEALILAFASGPILGTMGVATTSAMRGPAQQYLFLRAFGAPAVVVGMAVQGVFRGFKDTKTPLAATVMGSVIHIGLAPLLMFACGFGINGAAAATVVAQYATALWLLLSLSQRCVLLPPRLSDLKLQRFLQSGGLLLGRTLALLGTMTLATSMAARQGTTAMAAHQICSQIWLAVSLLSDSLALAGQALLAGAFASKDTEKVKKVTFRVMQLGFLLGILMAALLVGGSVAIPRAFTRDAGVLEIAALIMPFVAATQPITSLAFIFDGIHYGASDFQYAAKATILSALPAVACLLLLPQFLGIGGVWVGLTLLMSMRMFTGFVRIGTAGGPWQLLKSEPGPMEKKDGSHVEKSRIGAS